IAGTAGLVAGKSQNRRAVVVLTDGADTGSTFSPTEVSRIASTIDVPVYVFALGDVPTDANGQVVGALRDLVVETGGDVLVANTPGSRPARNSRSSRRVPAYGSNGSPRDRDSSRWDDGWSLDPRYPPTTARA